MMTRKNIIGIANAVNEVCNVEWKKERDRQIAREACALAARRIAAYCKNDNPRFNSEKFLRAALAPLET